MDLGYIYIRMSTRSQLSGDSLERQIKKSRKFAIENDIHIPDENIIKDIGVSAYNSTNLISGNLKKFIDDVDSDKIKSNTYFLVESFDRLSRDKILQSLNLFLKLLNKGINVVITRDNKIFQSENKNMEQDIILSIMYMVRAHEESEIKSNRLKSAWNSKRENIHLKILTSQCPSWLKFHIELK